MSCLKKTTTDLKLTKDDMKLTKDRYCRIARLRLADSQAAVVQLSAAGGAARRPLESVGRKPEPSALSAGTLRQLTICRQWTKEWTNQHQAAANFLPYHW